MKPHALRLAGGIGAIGAATAVYVRLLSRTNSTTVALTFLLIVLVVAATSRLWIAATTSVVAMLCFNFFFLPPTGTFTIAEPQNWVALFVFLTVSLIASNLSAAARARESEAVARQDELARLFDLSRDVLLITDAGDAQRALVHLVARRFALDYAAVCRPRGTEWDIAEQGALPVPLDRQQLTAALGDAAKVVEFDAAARTYAGHRTMEAGGTAVRLVPLRIGARPVGLLTAAGREVEAGTLDALAGVVAIAIERVQFLEERKDAELTRQGEALKSALLASIGHDLRTPLTAIRVAASNLRETWLTDGDRREQSEVILLEVERLSRLFENILDMARIDAAAVAADVRWVHLSEVFEAARDQVAHTLIRTPVTVQIADDALVRLDPRLTASALAHVLENAAQYSAEGAPVVVSLAAGEEEVTIQVQDRGPGIAPEDLPHLFERFYRGSPARQRAAGTGMGLAIARGLLATQGGRIWAENAPTIGALFTIVVPAERRSAPKVEA